MIRKLVGLLLGGFSGFVSAFLAAGLLQGGLLVAFGDNPWPDWAKYVLIPGSLAILAAGTLIGAWHGFQIAARHAQSER